MNQMREQSEFVERLKKRFDDSVRDMEAGTAARIAHAHREVLTESGNSSNRTFWLPAGAVATACLAVAVYSLMPDRTMQEESTTDEPDAVLEQMELISNLELYEDLEFYRWLEQDELPS